MPWQTGPESQVRVAPTYPFAAAPYRQRSNQSHPHQSKAVPVPERLSPQSTNQSQHHLRKTTGTTRASHSAKPCAQPQPHAVETASGSPGYRHTHPLGSWPGGIESCAIDSHAPYGFRLDRIPPGPHAAPRPDNTQSGVPYPAFEWGSAYARQECRYP